MEQASAKDALKDRLMSVQNTAHSQYKHALSASQEYISDNPWKAIGIAAAIGTLVGLLVSRR